MKGPKGIKAGSTIDEELLGTLSRGQWWQLALGEDTDAQAQEALHGQFELQKKALERRFEDKVEKVRRGDDLPPGVMKMVKVFIAVKRKLQPGDKMAGRHGNKGVISKVVPQEDMPFLQDGTPVDLVLNPLGVPSRMNVGQILETHMGWAARGLGRAIDEGLQEYRHKGDMTPLKEAMKIAYGEDVYNEVIADLPLERVPRGRRQRHRRRADRDPGLRRRQGGGRQRRAAARRLRHLGPVDRLRRPLGRAVHPAGHRRREVPAEAAPSGGRQDPRPLAPARTASSPSSRWAARRSSAASASARWRSGRWKPTARPTPCRRC